MIKLDLYITISRFMAILMVVLGFILSLILKEPSPFITACTASGVVIAIKTGIQAYGANKTGTSSTATETTETSTKTEESTT